jgi:hypothetical protein
MKLVFGKDGELSPNEKIDFSFGIFVDQHQRSLFISNSDSERVLSGVLSRNEDLNIVDNGDAPDHHQLDNDRDLAAFKYTVGSGVSLFAHMDNTDDINVDEIILKIPHNINLNDDSSKAIAIYEPHYSSNGVNYSVSNNNLLIDTDDGFGPSYLRLAGFKLIVFVPSSIFGKNFTKLVQNDAYTNYLMTPILMAADVPVDKATWIHSNSSGSMGNLVKSAVAIGIADELQVWNYVFNLIGKFSSYTDKPGSSFKPILWEKSDNGGYSNYWGSMLFVSMDQIALSDFDQTTLNVNFQAINTSYSIRDGILTVTGKNPIRFKTSK